VNGLSPFDVCRAWDIPVKGMYKVEFEMDDESATLRCYLSHKPTVIEYRRLLGRRENGTAFIHVNGQPIGSTPPVDPAAREGAD
jgi:hypothetical protein